MAGRGARRGAATLELALTLPFLLFLLIGIIEAGRYVRAVVAVSNAARNGASYACATTAASADEPAIRTAVLDEMAGFDTTAQNPIIGVTRGVDARNYACVTVSVEYRFSPLINFPGLPTRWDAKRDIQMRVLS